MSGKEVSTYDAPVQVMLGECGTRRALRLSKEAELTAETASTRGNQDHGEMRTFDNHTEATLRAD